MMKTLPVLAVCVLAYVVCSRACNEGLCASLVSKCLLIKSCECDMSNKRNCTCCRDCHMCLSRLYTECCSCVGMCPKTKLTLSQNASTIEDLPEPIPDLFEVLTEQVDPLDRWAVFSYAAMTDPRFLSNEHMLHVMTMESARRLPPSPNCTVAYMSQCLSLGKCKDACVSMGAARMRWFHEEGCCQCVGHTCLDYGLNKPKCLQCPEDEVSDTSAAQNVANVENLVEKAAGLGEDRRGLGGDKRRLGGDKRRLSEGSRIV